MREIHLIDTSVFCCILRVPGMCSTEQQQQMRSELNQLVGRPGISLLLPVATIYETGNHIAHAPTNRLTVAQQFAAFVGAGLTSQPPWALTPLPNHAQMGAWLAEFPARADAQVGLGDLSIIKTFEEQCAQFPTYRVRIWSIDEHLSSYDRVPAGSLFT